jgi:murein DD-endopeptidase MepM/ murein hydrolase activator NlpD
MRVIISHPNGTQTLYAHTSKNFVRVGDHVEQGQMIAKSGSTGNSTGPHLHVEVRNGKNPF